MASTIGELYDQEKLLIEIVESIGDAYVEVKGPSFYVSLRFAPTDLLIFIRMLEEAHEKAEQYRNSK
jgi:hypothetical protein